MKRDEAISILLNEIECVKRGSYCDRDCGKCDLVKEDFEIIEALEMGIHFIKTVDVNKNEGISENV